MLFNVYNDDLCIFSREKQLSFWFLSQSQDSHPAHHWPADSHILWLHAEGVAVLQFAQLYLNQMPTIRSHLSGGGEPRMIPNLDPKWRVDEIVSKESWENRQQNKSSSSKQNSSWSIESSSMPSSSGMDTGWGSEGVDRKSSQLGQCLAVLNVSSSALSRPPFKTGYVTSKTPDSHAGHSPNTSPGTRARGWKGSLSSPLGDTCSPQGGLAN